MLLGRPSSWETKVVVLEIEVGKKNFKLVLMGFAAMVVTSMIYNVL